jgi:RNA polymerase sigma-70 factor (ECF subfamily)
MAPPTDRELVDRARNGDAAAFDDLVRRHHARIHRLALHMLRDRAEAEDVAQETFIRAYQALARFDGRSEPYTWLYRIAVNLSLNLLRSRRGQASRIDVQDPRLDGLLTETRPSALADPPGHAERKELYIALCEGIDGLSESLRTTLILVCIDGRSHEEASGILGAPAGTIAWRVHEARRKLKAMLAERGFEIEDEEQKEQTERKERKEQKEQKEQKEGRGET